MTSNTTTLRDMAGEKLGFSIPKGMMSDLQRDELNKLIAREFLCRPDDVRVSDEGTDESDEGLEYITVFGTRVAYLDEGDGRGPNVVEILQAAE
jgi:hypothetical protein